VPDAEDPLDRPWTSAIHKSPVEGRIWLGAEGLTGDGQADRRHHGGPERALLAYAASHYPSWQQELGLPELGPGAFGENLTVLGLTEDTACIGDRLAIGDVVVEVAQPRQPCQNLARKLRVADMVKRVESSGRGGWYLRVIHEGWLEAGMLADLTGRPNPEWTIREAARVYQARGNDPASAARLAECAALSSEWRERLTLGG
jgi:MOSC domain-containing protein YiiM